jgi:tRNA(Ile)-lysidine synthase
VTRATLPSRLRRTLRRLGLLGGADPPVVIGFSGGLDSCVLLHLLRFGVSDAPSVVAAHYDHAMRRGSAGDARWVAGLCRAWSVPLLTGRADAPPASEAQARSARYAFLRGAHDEIGGRAILTAHHADDQAETVLFRALRGSGIDGLAGIREELASEPGPRGGVDDRAQAGSDAAAGEGCPGEGARPRPRIVRPLLDVWREELEIYARAVKLRWREDPTNEHLGFARNVIRRELLPLAEAKVAPGARRALARLATLAARDEEGWREVLPLLLERLDVRPDPGPRGRHRAGTSFDRAALHDLGEALRARVLRHLAALQGIVLGEAATARALEFVVSAGSGRSLELGGGVGLTRELDRLVLSGPGVGTPAPSRSDRPLVIPDVGPGVGEARVGGRELRCRWEPGAAAGEWEGFSAALSLTGVRFPLVVRGREPGDRMTTSGGTKKLKQLLLEARIPRGARERVPVVADAAGRVLWVPGVAVASDVGAVEGEAVLTLGISG